MRMPPPTRLAAALLLVYPALMLVSSARWAIEYRNISYLGDHLPLVLFLATVGVQLWRGRRWAYTAALVCSAVLPLILVLYTVAVAYVWGSEAWEGASPLLLMIGFVPVAAIAAAFALLVRDPSFTGQRRRALTLLAAALGVELVLMALIARFGVGGFSGYWYQTVLGLTQVPGEIILTQMGMCCGYENETIISDVIGPHWGAITQQGIPVLVAANALGLVPLLSLIRALLARRSGVRGAAPAVAG
jgi:hypothetical protein